MIATAPLTISGEAAVGGLGLASRTFYRGVDAAEAADFAAKGALRASPNGNAGKYFTNSIAAATQWAGKNGAQVWSVRVPADATKAFTRLGRIDGIGEAWYAPMSALSGAKVEVVKNLLTAVPK